MMLEIEELSKMFDEVVDCDVNETRCLGYCRRGPAVLITKEAVSSDLSDSNLRLKPKSFKWKLNGFVSRLLQRMKLLPPRERIVHVGVHGMNESVKLVENATGKKLLSYANVDEKKFQRIRRVRTRKHAKTIYRWNSALLRMEEDVKEMPSLREDYEELLEMSGFPNGLPSHFKDDFKMPSKIEMYSKWTLMHVSPVSKHSALYSFESSDLRRGSPHPRGSGRLPVPNTWHTTMLAEIGDNKEGPLPWIERDYTPISTAKDWEQGKLNLLIKVYPDGLATNWLLRRKIRDRVFFSKPIRTMNVPSLVTNDARQAGFFPKSVLLLLAGTGIVSLPQILHHRDPIRKLGLSTPKHYQLHVPIDLIASFREDDALYTNEIAEHCRRDELRYCTLYSQTSSPQNAHIETTQVHCFSLLRNRLRLHRSRKSRSKLLMLCRRTI